MNFNGKSKYESYSIEDLSKELSRREIIQKLKEFDSSFLVRAWHSMKKNTMVWISTFLISVFSIFSNYFVEEIHKTLTDANFKSNEYAEMANVFSEYNFSVELIIQFFDRKEEGSEYFKNLVNQYNEGIYKIRGKEYSNHALIIKHSDEFIANDYEELIDNVKVMDGLLRELHAVSMDVLQTKKGADIVYSEEMKNEINRRIFALQAAREALSKNTKSFLIGLE